MKKSFIALCFILFLMNGCNSPQKSDSAVSSKTDNRTKINFLSAYSIIDTKFGTRTEVKIDGNKRIMTTNGLPNHPTGEFPNEGNPNTITAQRLTYSFPLTPVFTGRARWARESGVALNGIKFEPETAEAFVCATGERYRIEAFQTLVNLGLDFNNAHVQPTGAYHYHGVPKALIDILYDGTDLMLVGFANDGFPIYYSKKGKYKPSYQLSTKVRTGDFCSYKNRKENINKDLKNSSPDGTFVSDWEYVKGLGDLDECNGKTIDGKYMYFVTDTYPYAGRCLMGEFTEQRPMGPPPGGIRPPGIKL